MNSIFLKKDVVYFIHFCFSNCLFIFICWYFLFCLWKLCLLCWSVAKIFHYFLFSAAKGISTCGLVSCAGQKKHTKHCTKMSVLNNVDYLTSSPLWGNSLAFWYCVVSVAKYFIDLSVMLVMGDVRHGFIQLRIFIFQ